MSVDLGVFERQKTVLDQQALQDAFNLKKALAVAELQKQFKPDIEDIGKQAFLKAAQGLPLAPHETAALSYLDSKQQNYGFNPTTGAIEAKPGLLQRAGMLGGAQPAATGGAMPPAGSTSTPPATPKTIQLKQELDAKAEAERKQGYTKAQSALQSLGQQSDLVISNIDKAIKTISPLSTGWGSYLDGIPNSDAGKLKNYLTTIQANIGFDKLQQMRDNSPTGGALGQVSDFENKLLQAANGALDPKQSDTLADNLKTIKELYPKVLEEKKRAFKQDYEFTQPLGNNPQPINQEPKLSIPEGAVYLGTKNGKPVYKLPDGRGWTP